ncbi:MAG: hypothetical protein AB7E72_17290 [Lysobacterales bacterium]
MLRSQFRSRRGGVQAARSSAGWRRLTMLLILLLALALPVMAQVSLSGQVIASGGGHAESAGRCLELDGTFGEAVAGSASGGSFTLLSGFRTGDSVGSSDSIFRQGFEECR